MKFGIRLRFALWLIAALLPVSIGATYVFGRIEAEVSNRVGTDLEGVRSLEASRIANALDQYSEHGVTLAGGPHVQEFTANVVRSRDAGTQDGVIGGYDGFAEIDALGAAPLQELAEALQRKTAATTAEVSALQIVAPDGEILGQTTGFDWVPYDQDIVQRAIESRTTLIGNAFRDADGSDHLGVVVPIRGSDDSIVGALVLENELGPIVDLVEAHEGFGDTSEAHIAQMDPEGNAEFITLLRFERDAAFTKVVPAEMDLPINQSLEAPEGSLLYAKDYRGEESILAVQTLEGTGWGLVIKIDRSEALAPVLDHTGALKGVAALGVIGVLFGWAVFLDPIARRLRQLSEGAEAVASGDYGSPLDDRRNDEIGRMAKSIDRLATDLAADIAVRTDVENRLRYQATHDATTQIYNRQHATALMQELVAPTQGDAHQPFSLLFLDLDNFKAINDVYGHATGDIVLATTAQRLNEVAGDRGYIARWGGDEFVMVLPRLGEGAAHDVANEVQRAFAVPVQTTAGEHQVRTSIGASTFQPGGSLEQLLHSADEAMFAEKQSRSGRRAVSPESVRAVEAALEDGNVEVWFQPLVSGNGSNVILQGAEALVRLRDRNGDMLEPANFLRDVERSHVGRDLDRQVLYNSLQQISTWISEGSLASDFQLSVNGSEAFMRDTETAQYVEQCLSEFELQPHNLMLEISEQSSMVQPQVIAQLDALGVKIAVDDLGLSNSNIDRLLDGGASVAKIDRRWLQTETQAESDANATVLRHLVSLCESLGFDVIAEGVETTEQYERMRNLGVSTFQGYLFARPLSGDDFAERFFPLASARHNDR